MEINKYLKKILKSGELNRVWDYKYKGFDFIRLYKPIVAEPKCTKIKWYFGKLKNNGYSFIFHVVMNGQNLGAIIPVDKDISNNEDFIYYFESAFKCFQRQYKTTMENK